MRNFKTKVLEFVKLVPKGKVVSYGQVAAAAGSLHVARQVGFVLRAADISKDELPWWRVVNSRGVISIKGNWTVTKELQKALLEKEGIAVDENFQLDMKKYRWFGNQ